jgi:hypothetical protein
LAEQFLHLVGAEKAKLEGSDPEAASHLDDALQAIRLAAVTNPTQTDPAQKLAWFSGDNVQKNIPSGPPASGVHAVYPFLCKKVR